MTQKVETENAYKLVGELMLSIVNKMDPLCQQRVSVVSDKGGVPRA